MLLASDFDGTLFFEHQLENYRSDDIKAIQKFQSLGYKFGVCTGRPLIGVTDFASPDFKFDFYIVNSGAIVLDRDFKLISKKEITLTTVEKVMDSYNDVEMLIATENEIYFVNSKNDFSSDFIINLTSKKQLLDKTIISFSLMFKTEKEAFSAKQDLQQYVDIEIFQNKTALDVVAKDCSKKSGLEAIANYYQLDKNDLACIGDSYNDISMLEFVDNSFTFDYSPLEVQQVANNVVSHLDQCIEQLLQKD